MNPITGENVILLMRDGEPLFRPCDYEYNECIFFTREDYEQISQHVSKNICVAMVSGVSLRTFLISCSLAWCGREVILT